MNHGEEGVIKFNLAHADAPALPVEETAQLRAWFPILHQTGLLGQEAKRYDGYAWGNISMRTKAGFIITCTQTSGKELLGAEDFTLVTHFDIGDNALQSRGPCQPSSEAMTHGMVYESLATVGAVFHAHSPAIWQQANQLGLAVTDPKVEYGTPEMAKAVALLLEKQRFSEDIVFCMGGHEDGVVACADTPQHAGMLLINTLVSAYQLSMKPALSN